MAELASPPGLPHLLEGILNLAGSAAPVLRLDRLLDLPEQPPGLYSMLIVLKGAAYDRVAILVDRVIEILSLPESAFLPVSKDDSFNGCAGAAVTVRGEVVHVLSPARILLEKERQALAEFQTMAQRRLQDWSPQQP